MENRRACEFLKHFLERIDVKDNGKFYVDGNITSSEIDALKRAIEVLGGGAIPIPTPMPVSIDLPPQQIALPVLPEPTFPDLVCDSLHAVQDNSVLLCLDFGTAMSKAFATIVEEGEACDDLPLKLGERAKQSGGVIYPIPSSIWISDDGLIFFGQKAIALSLQDDSGKRQRFDSLKKELTMGLPSTDLYQVQLPPEINPTGISFSKGAVITLYLAYLTDLACTELEDRYGKTRFAMRRFALPSWPQERMEWGKALMKKMLAKAQIVADTLHDRWDSGISIQEAKYLLDKVNKLTSLPEFLIKEGVTEPLAAGSSRLKQDENNRGLVMVVDVGAGTTDLAMFLTVENNERGIYSAYPIKNCNKSLSMAGDTLDGALFKAILEYEDIDTTHPDRLHITAELRMNIRSLKETLFKDGICDYVLSNGARGSIEEEDFLSRKEVAKFTEKLSETFQEVLDNADSSFLDRFKDDELMVVLTGGGATLPMVQDVACGSIVSNNIKIRLFQAALVPEEFEDDEELSEIYPQLAVAIGGSIPSMINEKATLNKMPGLAIPVNEWTLPRC